MLSEKVTVQPLCARPRLCWLQTHQKHHRVTAQRGFFCSCLCAGYSFCRKPLTSLLSCVWIDVLRGRMRGQGNALAWRGRWRCWITFVWCEAPDGGWTLQIEQPTMSNAPVDWIRSVCLHLCVYACACVCVHVHCGQIKFSNALLPVYQLQ